MLALLWPRPWQAVFLMTGALYLSHSASAQNFSQSASFAIVRTASPTLSNSNPLGFGAPGDCECNYGTVLGFSMAANRGQPPNPNSIYTLDIKNTPRNLDLHMSVQRQGTDPVSNQDDVLFVGTAAMDEANQHNLEPTPVDTITFISNRNRVSLYAISGGEETGELTYQTAYYAARAFSDFVARQNLYTSAAFVFRRQGNQTVPMGMLWICGSGSAS